MNYFESLELPEKLIIDPQDLEKRFYAASRKWHPDRFARATADAQQQALDTSATINDAYRTLRDPVARTEYLLSLKGIAPGVAQGPGEDAARGAKQGDAQKVPPELLEEVFELNMVLEELKMGDRDALPQLRQARERFQTMLGDADRDLEEEFRQWDNSSNPDVLDRLRAQLNHRKYISNLVRDTGNALEDHVSD